MPLVRAPELRVAQMQPRNRPNTQLWGKSESHKEETAPLTRESGRQRVCAGVPGAHAYYLGEDARRTNSQEPGPSTTSTH